MWQKNTRSLKKVLLVHPIPSQKPTGIRHWRWVRIAVTDDLHYRPSGAPSHYDLLQNARSLVYLATYHDDDYIRPVDPIFSLIFQTLLRSSFLHGPIGNFKGRIGILRLADDEVLQYRNRNSQTRVSFAVPYHDFLSCHCHRRNASALCPAASISVRKRFKLPSQLYAGKSNLAGTSGFNPIGDVGWLGTTR